MWPLPVPGGGGGYRSKLSQTFLPQKHRHGLAPKERHVCFSPVIFSRRSRGDPSPGLQPCFWRPRRQTTLYLSSHIRPTSLEHPPRTFLTSSSSSLKALASSWRYGTPIEPYGASGLICRCDVFQPSAVTLISFQSLLSIAEDERSRDVYETALKHVRDSRFTDAELIYAPSQIALAALSLASPLLAQKWLDSKLLSVGESSPEAPQNAVNAIKGLITHTGHPPDVEAVREVDRRLKLCKNPEKVVGSKAYLARKAEEERKAEAKRNKKAEDINRAMEGDDPFGSAFNEGRHPQRMEELDDDDD